jgi:predicted RND superfamily exporter protein
VAPLILGVGSDYGIHIVDRLDRGQPVSQVLREISEPMLITTVTTIAGFACFAFATFPGVREMGVVAAFGLAICHVASLHVLPIGYTRLASLPPAP